MKYILLILVLLMTGCVGPDVRKSQSELAGNIYWAAYAIELGVDPKYITPEIKKQALLIMKINKDTLKGVNNGN